MSDTTPEDEGSAKAADTPNETPEQAQRLRSQKAWERLGKANEACPMCGSKRWVAGYIVDLPIRLPGSRTGTVLNATSVYPSVPIFCTTCGFTHFHMAKTLLKDEFSEGEES